MPENARKASVFNKEKEHPLFFLVLFVYIMPFWFGLVYGLQRFEHWLLLDKQIPSGVMIFCGGLSFQKEVTIPSIK